jgi:phosphohistidine phosphatase SixA
MRRSLGRDRVKGNLGSSNRYDPCAGAGFELGVVMKHAPRHALVFMLLALVSANRPGPALAQEPRDLGSAKLVLLVRHAEKACRPAADRERPLNRDGKKRAEELKTVLRNVGVTAIVTSTYPRTGETAQPLAAVLGINPQPVELRREEIGEHIEKVAAAVRHHADGAILVVGHTATIPGIIQALGGQKMPKIPEPVYDRFFVLTSVVGTTRVVQLRYGAPGETPECP